MYLRFRTVRGSTRWVSTRPERRLRASASESEKAGRSRGFGKASDRDAEPHDDEVPHGFCIAHPECPEKQEADRGEYRHPQMRIEIEREDGDESQPRIPPFAVRFLKDSEQTDRNIASVGYTIWRIGRIRKLWSERTPMSVVPIEMIWLPFVNLRQST